jgi:hypothetical protein
MPAILSVSFQRFPANHFYQGGCKASIRPSAKACGVLESAAYASICEHFQKPHNAGSRPQAQFFNTLL